MASCDWWSIKWQTKNWEKGFVFVRLYIYISEIVALWQFRLLRADETEFRTSIT